MSSCPRGRAHAFAVSPPHRASPPLAPGMAPQSSREHTARSHIHGHERVRTVLRVGRAAGRQQVAAAVARAEAGRVRGDGAALVVAWRRACPHRLIIRVLRGKHCARGASWTGAGVAEAGLRGTPRKPPAARQSRNSQTGVIDAFPQGYETGNGSGRGPGPKAAANEAAAAATTINRSPRDMTGRSFCGDYQNCDRRNVSHVGARDGALPHPAAASGPARERQRWVERVLDWRRGRPGGAVHRDRGRRCAPVCCGRRLSV